MAQADEREFVWGEALYDVVDRDVGWAADKDAEVAGGELEDELDESVGLSGLEAGIIS